MKLFKFIKAVLAAGLLIALFVLYSNITVYRAGKTGVFKVEECPPAQAALVLGARVYQGGTLSPILADRVETGIELYKSGKVEKILFTGDHGQVSYDEVNHLSPVTAGQLWIPRPKTQT